MEKHSTGSGMGQHPKLLTRKAPQKNQRFQHYESRKQMSHAKRRSKEIDRSLKEDARKRRSQCVVSIDGIHNSGPRFARQLQILISHGLPHEQRLSHKNNIQQCLCQALRSAATATRDETKSPITTTTKRTAEQILTQLPNPGELEPGWRPSPDTVAAALLLWSDEGLRETLKSKRQPWIPGQDSYDSSAFLPETCYFLAHVARIAEAAYIPTDEDVIAHRTHIRPRVLDLLPGLTINSLTFQPVCMRDVYNPSRGHNWPHLSAIDVNMYVIDLSCYGSEDPDEISGRTYTPFQEVLVAIEDMATARMASPRVVFVFVNVGWFRALQRRAPLNMYLDGYRGSGSDEAVEFLEAHCRGLGRDSNRKRKVSVVWMEDALDTGGVYKVMQEVNKEISKEETSWRRKLKMP